MILRAEIVAGLWGCIPRESGDDPDLTEVPAVAGEYSPRERG